MNKKELKEQMANVLDNLKKVAELASQRPEIERTVPMKPEWKKMYKEFSKKKKEIIEEVNKLEAQRDLFWALVTHELGVYDTQMSVSDDEKEIEIHKKEED